MKKFLWSGLLAALLVQASVQASLFESKHATLGGAPVQADATIAENLSNSMEHNTLVDSLKAVDLFDTLKGKGPYTIFAPTNVAFDKLPTDALGELLKPERKPTLTRILSYHIVEGRYDSQALTKLMRDTREGRAQLITLEGHKLIFSVSSGGHDLQVTDDKGTTAKITAVDLKVANGFIQVIDRVMQP
ncbi:MAG: fasciclin domain protein [Nevskia sp.]|nr:fasciclin domain protein [Nevskia sp.]